MTPITKKNIRGRLINTKFILIYFTIQFVLLIVYSCEMPRSRTDSDIQNQSDLSKEFYSNGSLKEVGALIDSLKQGYWITYDSVGNLQSECVYVNDIINGEFNIYYPNGEPKVIGYMYHGEWKGKRDYYYSNGNIRNTGCYEDGKLDGVWEYYDENGYLDKKIEYEKGEMKKIIEDNKHIPAFP